GSLSANRLLVVGQEALEADVATIPYKVIASSLKHPLTDIGLERFLADYKKAIG
ncbi:MAG: fructose-6-phosphate aldolase, partial [Phycisphaerales bacterium JB038]